MTAIIILMGGMLSEEEDLAPMNLIAEFERLLTKLDIYALTRAEWDRFKAILTEATLELGDSEKGRLAYERAAEKWRRCRLYDGSD